MINSFWNKHKKVLFTIITLFIVSRVVLTVISGIALANLTVQTGQEWKKDLTVIHPLLSTWAVWDSEWYMKIAKDGYADLSPFDPKVYSSVGFFPLYPFAVFIVNSILGDLLVSGFIVSNICFLMAVFLLYLLVKENSDEDTAERSMWYLFLFPSAYIFSAVYPESLLLLLWLSAVYFAQKKKWLPAGLSGFLAATAKPIGFFIFIPLFVIYFCKKEITWNFWKNSAWRKIRPDILWVFLVPLGLLAVSYLHYRATGDVFAYSHVQQGAWGHYLAEPFSTIYKSITDLSFDWSFNAWVIVFMLILLVGGYRSLPFAYWIFAFLALIFIPTNGVTIGVLRYVASFFPFVILLSMWGKNKYANWTISTSMAMLQGCFFIFWILGYWFVS